MKDLKRAESFCTNWKPEYNLAQDDVNYDEHTRGALDYYSAPLGANPFMQSMFKLYVDSAGDQPPLKALELLEKVPPLPLQSPLTTFSTPLSLTRPWSWLNSPPPRRSSQWPPTS